MKYIILITLLLLIISKNTLAQRIVNHQNTYTSQHVGLPIEEMRAALAAKQAQYNKELSDCQQQIVQLYESATHYPTIRDGKHLVNLLGQNACNEVYVIVDKGRVFSIIKNGGGYITDFSISTPIKDGVSKIGIPNSETGITQYLQVIFLKDIYDN